jgi:hypothetical protein
MMEYRKSQKGKSCEQMSELDRLRQAEDKEQRHTNRKKNAGSFSDGGTSRNRGRKRVSSAHSSPAICLHFISP